jgi:hypothetical protein
LKRALRALLCLVGFSAAAASAQVLTFTFTGNINGDVGGTPFTNAAFTLVVTADGSKRSAGGFPITAPLTSGTITIAGTACSAGCTMTTPAAYEIYNLGVSFVHGISTLGNPQVAGQTLFEACFDCGGTPVNDNLTATIPPTAAGAFNALAPYLAFPTSGGAVTIALINSLTYAAGGFNVPTLSEWALMVLAGLLGVAGFWHLGRRAPLAA